MQVKPVVIRAMAPSKIIERAPGLVTRVANVPCARRRWGYFFCVLLLNTLFEQSASL
jgi:hypothetical protein